MAKIKIDKKKCKACLLCIRVCPRSLLKTGKAKNNYGVNAIEFIEDTIGCIGCGQCVLVCPEVCIEIYEKK